MPRNNDWRETTLEQIAAEVTVGYVGPMAKEYVSVGVPFLRSTNIHPFHLDLTDLMYINPDFHAKIKKSALKPGDVVIVRTGKPGVATVIPESLPVANCSDLVIVRPGPELDANFLAYYVNSVAQSHISAHLVGAVQQHFNIGSAKQIELQLPPLVEQKKIARILGALDDKIELNRRMNRTLEHIAAALFKSWFVDFDPVAAKLEGRQPYGMNTATAALFPAAFQDSELGPIPEGWQTKSLPEIADFENGLALQKFPPEGADYLPVIKIRELRQGFSDDSSDKASRNIKPSCIINDGDVVFSWSGSLMVDVWCGGKGALNQHLFIVTSENYPKWFYLNWIIQHLTDFQDIASGKATTMGHIQRHHLSSALVLVPSPELLDRMNGVMTPLLEKAIRNRIESRTLARIRDALLPKLLSGEIRVKTAERQAERALA